MFSKIQKFLIIIFLIIGFTLGLGFSVLAWINPSQSPPSGGGIIQTDTSGLKIVTTTQITSGNLIVTSSGKVGIGTMSPGSLLFVFTNNTGKRQISTNHWIDISAGPAGYGAVMGNAYYDNNGTSNNWYYANTHSSIGAIGFAVNYPSFNKASVITSGVTSSVSGATFTPSVIATFDYTGKVGIGTSLPGAKFHVLQSSNTEPAGLFINDGGSGEGLRIQAGAGGAGYAVLNAALYNGVSLLYVRGDGNVGIGTTNPQRQLHVYGSGNPNLIRIQSSQAPGSSGIEFVSDPQNSMNEWRPGYIVSGDNGSFTGRLDFYTNGTGSGNKWGSVLGMSIVNGNVGIGTTVPQNKLDVNGGMAVGSYAGVNTAPLNGLIISGNVGIGTTVPEAKLNIPYQGSGHAIMIGSSANTGGHNFELTISMPSGATHWPFGITLGSTRVVAFDAGGNLRVDATGNSYFMGNVGIGTTNPGAYKLYVNGTAFSTGGWQQPSDTRLKNILGNIQNPLEKLMNLNGVIFTWKKDEFPNKGFPEGVHFGLTAQEVEKVLPEIIREDNEGYKTISYNELIPLLIEAIKEQQEKIKNLEERIKNLERTRMDANNKYE